MLLNKANSKFCINNRKIFFYSLLNYITARIKRSANINCEHKDKTEIERDYQERFIKLTCDNCGDEFYVDI